MIKDYYQILGLKRDSSAEDVAQNYKKKVLRWHPKFAKQDQQTAYYHFSQISQSYQVLSDPIKRAFYDKYGYQKLRQGLFSQGQLKGGYRFSSNPDQIFQRFFESHNAFSKIIDKQISEKGSLFSYAFGGLNYKQNNSCENLIIIVECTLNQLYTGVAKRVNYKRKVLNLDGRTTEFKDQSKLIEIKPGFSEDNVLVFKKQGHQNIHRTVSDLVFKIKQVKHQKYVRNKNDLIYTTQIQLAEALDCKALQIVTLDSRKLRVAVDQLVSAKTLWPVEGEGMPILSAADGSKKKGNLYVRFDIIFPKQLPEKTKARLRELLK